MYTNKYYEDIKALLQSNDERQHKINILSLEVDKLKEENAGLKISLATSDLALDEAEADLEASIKDYEYLFEEINESLIRLNKAEDIWTKAGAPGKSLVDWIIMLQNEIKEQESIIEVYKRVMWNISEAAKIGSDELQEILTSA